MLLTRMSGNPSPFRSARSTPMPLNESRPSALECGVLNVSSPFKRSKRSFPGVERLCRRRSGPKSLAKYNSGSRSPSISTAPTASVHPWLTSSARTFSASLKCTVGSAPPIDPVHRSRCLRPPFSALDIDSCIPSSLVESASSILAPSGK